MKIALSNDIVYKYASGDPSATGGAERLQWLFARALAATGWSVVVGVRDQLPFRQEKSISGVRFVGIRPGARGDQFLRAWAQFLDAERPDWFYWQGADPLWGALLLIAKAKGVRGIFSAAFDRDVRPRIALNRRRSWWPLYAWGLRTVEHIFVQHSGQLSGLSSKLHSKTTILPGVVTQTEKPRSRAERGNYVAWVAVLRQPKRPDLLIEMARKSPGLHFIVCGGTSTHRTPPGYSERMAVELRSLPNVEYLGHVAPDRTLETIRNAIALVSTSDQEGFPSVFLEAWAAGTPVVSLEIDPGGVIKDRGLGFVSGTVDQALSDIDGLFNTPEGFEAVSKRARKYIEEVHSEAAVARVATDAIAVGSFPRQVSR